MKKIAVAFLVSLLTIVSASADELSIIGHGFSKHLNNHNYRERNYGIGLRYEHDDYGVQIGAYKNSIYKDSVYIGVDWNILQYQTSTCFKYDAGVYYGAVTGYTYAVTPVVGLQAAIKCQNVFVRVRAIPDPFYNAKAVGSIEFGFVVKKF
jgi:hypothetical protein